MVAHVYKLPADLDHSNVKVDFGGHSVIASEIVYQYEDWANVVVSIPLSMSSHRVIPQLSACSCRDDPDWMETNSETVDNDQGGQTTTTWNTKCEWVASNLDNLGQLCNTPIHGYAAVETVREKCPLACGLCERVKWTTCTSDCYSNSPPGSLRRVGKQPRDAARSQLRHALPPKEAAHAELRRRLKALAPQSGRVRVRNAGGCLSPYTLEALDLQNITPTACTSTACSLFVLTLGVPALAD